MTDQPEKSDHELIQFFNQDLVEMSAEYERIRARTLEDPGTAGDEGEEIWAELLRSWLPEQYRVLTKGRILAADGTAGPQVDVVVLRPGYPKRLLSKKLYMAGGVAAVFECKNTLKGAHIVDSFARAARVATLAGNPPDTPFGQLVPAIPFGLLAHSHEWQAEGSHPHANVDQLLQAQLDPLQHLKDAPVVVCIADTGCWNIFRSTYDGPGMIGWEQRRERFGGPDAGFASVQYTRHTEDLTFGSPPPNAIAPMVAFLVSRLAHTDVAIRPLSQYFHSAGLSGSGRSVAKTGRFVSDVYSAEVLAGLPRNLTNGVWGSDWSVGYMY
jgi:hypothetical protein